MRYNLRASIAVLIAECMGACVVLAGCTGYRATGGYEPRIDASPAAGKVMLQSYGCGSCHTIPGIRTATGMVGPPLLYFSRRTLIAGELPNTPDNLIRWIQKCSSHRARNCHA